MSYLEPAPIDARFTEHDIVLPHLVMVIHILGAVEPHQVCNTLSVGEMSHNAFLACAHAVLFEAEYAPTQLHKRHVGLQLAYSVDAAAVYIFIGKVLQQVAPCADIQFFVEYLFAARPHAWQEHDVLAEQFIIHSS